MTTDPTVLATATTTTAAPRARAGWSRWIERRLGLTPTGSGLVVLALLGFVLGRAVGSRSLFLLAYGALGALGVAWILGRRTLSVVSLRSDLPTRAREGQRLDVTLSLTASRRVSTVIIEEELPAALGGPRRVAVPVLPNGRSLEHAYTFQAERRGRYEVGPLVAEWSDPFGLTRRRQVLLEGVPLIVHPTVQSANDLVSRRAWEDPPQRPPSSRPWPSGFEFYGMRDYVHGDDPRRIVWRATARTLDFDSGEGRYLVWEAEQGVTDQVLITLDTDQRHHSRGEPSTTLETAIRAAAALGRHHLDNGFAVTLADNAAVLAAGLRGRRSLLPLLDRLAAVERGPVSLLPAIERTFAGAISGAHHIVITPELRQDAATRLRLLLDRGASVLLVLIVTEDTDAMVLHRAGALQCPVVEVRPDRPLAPAFQHIIGAGRS